MMKSIMPFTYEELCDDISKQLKPLIENGEKNFVLYPFSGNGILTADILSQSFGIQPTAIIDP